MNQRDQVKRTIKVWSYAIDKYSLHVCTDVSDHAKLGYVQDIIEVYLNTEMQGNLFVHVNNKWMRCVLYRW